MFGLLALLRGYLCVVFVGCCLRVWFWVCDYVLVEGLLCLCWLDYLQVGLYPFVCIYALLDLFEVWRVRSLGVLYGQF